MSSAKTIADILSFSELIDAKSFIGNPFTSQPMYIVACAFLMESAYYSSPSSRSASPPAQTDQTSDITIPDVEASNSSERKPNPKHVLLASAAKENYQRCYRALKSLETYWEGTKYILTVLDQKAKGIGDPLLYTPEEMDSTVELPPVQPFAPPTWRRARTPNGSAEPPKKQSDGPPVFKQEGEPQSNVGASPRIDPSQGEPLDLPIFLFMQFYADTANSNRMGAYWRDKLFTTESKLAIPNSCRTSKLCAHTSPLSVPVQPYLPFVGPNEPVADL